MDRRPGVVYVDIHPPAKRIPPSGCQTISKLKPPALTEIDNVLWNNLVDVLNPIVYKLNRGTMVLFTMMVLYMIALISNIFFVFLYVEVWIYIVVAVIFMVGYLSILGWNQQFDRQLCEIVTTEFQPRFAAQGHELRYVTSNTGLCIGKNATVERFLEFKRTMVAEATAIVVNTPSTTNDRGSQNNTNNTTTGGGTENTTINNTDDKVAVASPAVVVEDDIEKNNTTNRNLSSTSKVLKSEVKAENVDSTNTYSSTLNSNPSVVDQMMADLHRPL
eukprot:CAMPEP_0170772120 /NCGR_PEP_ID=MMETSP0733-20121128/8481_1 /TAXON_ID=186038 /ORGANISM="Fragilariopsis kerguelensis, Strain L26-C5" /LENGTH=274 /DNA_ID=CAMNT_0011114041 /DNA_START=103 /DNA_END=927 /DNA_ORIENTATION=-